MKAFLLAAGLGQRLRPLTERTPKPLVVVAGKPLIQWHIEKLREAGIDQLVINHHWLGEQLLAFLGDGSALGVHIQWSPEPTLLNTGGGIRAALPLLNTQSPFALISADVWSDMDYRRLVEAELHGSAAQLMMVPNPDFHRGDFGLDARGFLKLPDADNTAFTYSGIGVLDPAWVAEWKHSGPVFPLLEPLQKAVRERRIRAMLHRGRWTDVGTSDRLARLRGELQGG